MMPQRSRGTAARTIGIPPSSSNGQAAPKAVRAQPKAGDRWALVNAINERLGWMPDANHRVLHALARYANSSKQAWPGQSRLAENCGCHRTTIGRRLRRLIGWGVIEVVRKGHKGSQNAAVYRILPPSRWPTERPPKSSG